MDDVVTRQQLIEKIVVLLMVVERRQERDAAKNADAGSFWQGYQAALHDLLHVLEVDATTTTLMNLAASAAGEKGGVEPGVQPGPNHQEAHADAD
jgi:hypothetical protein